MEGIREAMSQEARWLGELIIAKERLLDSAFARATIDEATLRTLTEEIGRAQAELRFSHLRAHHLESLTDTLEAEARKLLDRVAALGGAVRAIETGYFQQAIGHAAYEYQCAVEHGDSGGRGVNQFTDDGPPAGAVHARLLGARKGATGARARGAGAARRHRLA